LPRPCADTPEQGPADIVLGPRQIERLELSKTLGTNVSRYEKVGKNVDARHQQHDEADHQGGHNRNEEGTSAPN